MKRRAFAVTCGIPGARYLALSAVAREQRDHGRRAAAGAVQRRSSHACFVARYVGYPDVKLYDGSFLEWSRQPAATFPVDR